MSKVSIGHIFADHFETLRNFETEKRSWSDVCIFILLPVILGGAVVYFGMDFDKLVGDLLKAIAIFSAFLFNLLAVVNSAIKEVTPKNQSNQLRILYTKEIHANLSFNILIGIILVITLIIQSFLTSLENLPKVFLQVMTATNVSLTACFILTMVMCLNRVYILVQK